MNDMKVAGFREKLHARAAAAALREHGYDTEVLGIEGETSPMRIGDLPEPVLNARWAKAFVLSNCDAEHFREIVVNNYGTIVWQHRPGRFSRIERETSYKRYGDRS